MNIIAIATTVASIVEAATVAAPALYRAGTNLMPFAEVLFKKVKALVTGQPEEELTEEEKVVLDNKLQELYERLQKPLPPEQSDDI